MQKKSIFKESMAVLSALSYFLLLCSLLFSKTVAADQPSDPDADNESSQQKTIGLSIFAGIVFSIALVYLYHVCKERKSSAEERQRLFPGGTHQPGATDNAVSAGAVNAVAESSTNGSNQVYTIYDVDADDRGSAVAVPPGGP